MRRGNERFEAYRNIIWGQWELYLTAPLPDGRMSCHILGEHIAEAVDAEGDIPKNSALTVSESAVQTLMDSLWSQGVRPSNGVASTGQLEATERHLADLRGINQILLAATVGVVDAAAKRVP